MNESLFFFGILLWYVAVISLAVTVGVAWRKRHWIAVLVAAAIPCAGAALSWHVNREAGYALFSAAAFTIVSQGVVYGWMRLNTTWKDVKAEREIRRQTVLHLILITLSALFLVPFAWLVTTSLKEDEDMSKFPPVWVPRQQVKTTLEGKQVGLATARYLGQPVTVGVLKEFESGERLLQVIQPASLAGQRFELPRSRVTKIKRLDPVWKNYTDALKFLPPETMFGLTFLENTLLLSGLTVLGTILSSSLVAFSFARLRWPGRDLLFVVLLATMMIPGAVTMMPKFLIFRQLGWIDSLRPLWAPAFFGDALSIFLLRQFFLTIPNELEESARIDGASYFTIYWRIMLPLITPALAAITIMTFMRAWNDFMGPLIYVSSPLRMPLAYALQLYQTAHGSEPGLLMAAATMMMLPVLVLFFFTQRYFIQGVTLTGLKG